MIILAILAIVVGVCAWGVCGVAAGGLYFAYFQREWPSLAERDYVSDKRKAVCWGLFGPLSLIVSLFMTGTKHGLKFR